jgi:serine protease AprX
MNARSGSLKYFAASSVGAGASSGPSSPRENLVNNLNLIVSDPSGKRYVGNQKTVAGTSLKLDAENNVEVVEVQKAKAGKWTIDVVAGNVPAGPREFALTAVAL